MSYKENPKTKGSGILTCIPQTGQCPNGCADCFFQSGRSYLEPLDSNLPNMPEVTWQIVRVNDGNDSNVDRPATVAAVQKYPLRFYNTAIPERLDEFDAPVVLTVNPGKNTDSDFTMLYSIPKNLMFVRFRTTMWNVMEPEKGSLADRAVCYYTEKQVPVVLTFMAFFTESVPDRWKSAYEFRKRTLNHYWAITHSAWRQVMERYESNPYVYSCGKEGVSGGSGCQRCGNCLREFFAAKCRMEASV